MRARVLLSLAIAAAIAIGCGQDTSRQSTGPKVQASLDGAQIAVPYISVNVNGSWKNIKNVGDYMMARANTICNGNGYAWRSLGVNGSTTSNDAIAIDTASTSAQKHYGVDNAYGFLIGPVGGYSFRVDSVTATNRYYSFGSPYSCTTGGDWAIYGVATNLTDDSEGSVLIP